MTGRDFQCTTRGRSASFMMLCVEWVGLESAEGGQLRQRSCSAAKLDRPAMTTPFERTLAVVETMHFLGQLSTGRLPATSLKDLQNVADTLLRHYPDETNLRLSAQLLPLLWPEPGAHASDTSDDRST